MGKPILVPALLLVLTSSFGQNTNSGPSGGKTNEVKTAPSKKKSVPKPASNQDKPLYSPCGVYYKDREDMIGQSNLSDKWFSLGESANKHFWYNPHKTTCDAKTGVLKTWMKGSLHPRLYAVVRSAHSNRSSRGCYNPRPQNVATI